MEFNIETYLNVLPEDIKYIDVSNHDLEYLPPLTRFKNLEVLCCSYNRLTSLPKLNENLKKLWCRNNRLTSLPELNDKLELLYCSYNHLSLLPELNDKLELLICCDNQLTSLPELNDKLEVLNCAYNQLTSLPKLNENLEALYCYDNQLRSLPQLNKKITKIDCDNNKLTYLPLFNNRLNSRLNFLSCKYNPISEIIDEININKQIKQIHTLNKFRHLFYSLKFKEKIRDWLWLKIREPKIMEQFHPSCFLKNLDEDSEEISDKWL
jgi:Leucine-rich repeat (LRR) protein